MTERIDVFDNIKSSKMFYEIMEVVDKLDLDEWQRGFLQNIAEDALKDELSGPQRVKLEEIYQTLKRIMHTPMDKQGAWLRSVFRGQLNYYAVPGTAEALSAQRKAIGKLWLKALRRRSQKKGKRLNWSGCMPSRTEAPEINLKPEN